MKTLAPFFLLVLCAPASGEDAVQHFLRRRAALEKVYVEYDWLTCRCYHGDPFNPNNWDTRPFPESFNTRYRAWILRPHIRTSAVGPGFPEAEQNTSWLDGILTKKALAADGSSSVIINTDVLNFTGPIPFLTPLEILQTFDVKCDLFSLAENGALRVVEETAERVVLEGSVDLLCRAETQGPPRNVRVELDPQNNHVPSRVVVETNLPGHKAVWEMRVVGTAAVGETTGISEAILVLTRTPDDLPWSTVYHFKADRYEVAPRLGRAEIEIPIPAAAVKLVDVTRGIRREVDATGKVIREERFTGEQYDQDRRAAGEAFQLREASVAELARRQRWFTWLVWLAGSATVLLFGAWLWKRRSLARA